MIDRQELTELARELSLALPVVEKDYVLGWLLAGISAHDALAGPWVFKDKNKQGYPCYGSFGQYVRTEY